MNPKGERVATAAVAAVSLGYTYDETDCQAFVEHAVKTAGGAMVYDGSNHMARNMEWLGTIKEAKATNKLVPGALLFIHTDDESNLPDRYKGDGMGDFEHVGLYVGENALTDKDQNGRKRKCNVVHSSATMQRVAGSTLKNGWTHVGWAKEIDYGDNDISEEELDSGETVGDEGLTAGVPVDIPAKKYAIVVTQSGEPVKIRKSASRTESTWWKVNNGARVLVEHKKKDWTLVKAICTDGYTRRAYIMNEFLDFG